MLKAKNFITTTVNALTSTKKKNPRQPNIKKKHYFVFLFLFLFLFFINTQTFCVFIIF